MRPLFVDVADITS